MPEILNDTFRVRRLFTQVEHPWDEVLAVEGGRLRLRSGERLRVDQALAATAARVLGAPALTGNLEADALAFTRALCGPWAPQRAAHALLELAVSARASDIHLEPSLAEVLVRFRLVGDLRTVATLSAAQGARLTAALKAISGCLPYRRDVVQEGRVPRAGVTADVRASFVPTALGDRVALRLFGTLLDFAALGLSPAVQARFELALARPTGLLVVAGPSGAGKTTTLYAALAHLARRRAGAHLSLEDPVEQRLRVAGVPVDQVELCPERGLTAEAALVAALRQDVDVLCVAEIRTPAEARLALQAAHTGRLVLAGLHAGSVAEARARLLELGLEQRQLDDTLGCVLHQRLETVRCDDASPGCPRCHGLGRLRSLSAQLWTAPDAPGLREVA